MHILVVIFMQMACFQLVLASDYRTHRTYSAYNYNNMGWKVQTPNSQGFQSEPFDQFDFRQLSKTFHTSSSPIAYELPRIKGSLGKYLISLFKLNILNIKLNKYLISLFKFVINLNYYDLTFTFNEINLVFWVCSPELMFWFCSCKLDKSS